MFYQKIHQASSLLVSLIIISGILSVIFITKDHLTVQDKKSLFFQQEYLAEILSLKDKFSYNLDDECNNQKTQTISFKIKNISYHFHCEFNSLFKIKPTKEKYIQFQNIEDYLNLSSYKNNIIYISSLNELPKNSEDIPYIVVPKNEINETLPHNFYGIIITEYLFDITGKYKFYGTLYSSFNNQREERNITYKKEVINNLENKYSQWHYLPHSKSISANE